jgi:hypothetical protein
VLVGKVDRANAAVAGQLLNTVIRAVGVELKVSGSSLSLSSVWRP